MEDQQPLWCMCGHVINRHVPNPEINADLACESCDCADFQEESTEPLF